MFIDRSEDQYNILLDWNSMYLIEVELDFDIALEINKHHEQFYTAIEETIDEHTEDQFVSQPLFFGIYDQIRGSLFSIIWDNVDEVFGKNQ
jgi:hypothetical protein